MSVCYWMCEGIGVRTNQIYKYLNKERCYREIKELLPDEDITVEGFNIDDYMYGEPFENLGDFLSQVDPSETTSWNDNNDGEYYFLYSPKYPWELTDKDPKSLDETREIIKNTIRKVCDIDEETLDKFIDNDIYEYGCG